MSSDDGFILRQNSKGKFVVQEYCASAEAYPDVDKAHDTEQFDTLDEAIALYQELNNKWPTEYGLTVQINSNKKETKMQTESYKRTEFLVEVPASGPVSEENIEEIAEWCGGEILKTKRGAPYIKVPVVNPLKERQTMAFLGDWVLFAHKRFKVYTDQAFKATFEWVAPYDKVTVSSVVDVEAESDRVNV